MGADFCLQELSVTMATRIRSDVITSSGCLAWWGYFGGLQCESILHSEQFIVAHQEKYGDYPVN